MPIRLVAIDLDGTLLNSRWKIPAANRHALARAAGQGVHVVLVTGRRIHSAEPFVREVPCPVTLIASNGALIRSSSGEVLHRDFLPLPTARKVVRIAREFRPYTAALFDTPGRAQILMENTAVPDGPLGWYLKNNPEWLTQVPDLEAAIQADPIQVMFGGPPARIEPVEPLLGGSTTGKNVHLTWTKYLTRNISILDVMNKGCSKGRTLELWAKRCGINASEVMAIGDNYNDLEMLEFAGRPVVMQNSSPGLARDNWLVTLSNDQGGVARAIETYVLDAE